MGPDWTVAPSDTADLKLPVSSLPAPSLNLLKMGTLDAPFLVLEFQGVELFSSLVYSLSPVHEGQCGNWLTPCSGSTSA